MFDEGLSRRDFALLARNVMIGTAAAGMLPRAASAQVKSVNLGTFGSVDVQNFIRATNAVEQIFGAGTAANFVTVRAGSEVIAAMAGGSLDMCNIGSSPMVVGYANGVGVSMVYVYKNIIDSEAMVVQKDSGLKTLADLKGKKIGLPFNTSVHFAALAALDTVGLKAGDVTLINMRADTILSAWQRKEIDASYIWVPVVPRLQAEGGEIIFKTGDLNKKGLVIFDGFLVRDEFKQKNPDLVLAFLKGFEKLAHTFKTEPKVVVDTMTKFLNIDEAAVMRSLNTFYPVPPAEQLTKQWMGKPGEKDTGVLNTLKVQADFLKASGQINAVPADLSPLVDSSFVAKMV